jgi:chromosome segregation ATPase
MGNNTAGWSLTGRLILKHFGALGDSVAAMLANFDPETATQADRDRLEEKVRATAEKYVTAKGVFEKEHEDVISLRAAIARDENVAAALVEKLTAGAIDEATAQAFCDELESEKSRLGAELQEEADAKAFMDELKSILDEMSSRLAAFDKQAAKVRQELERAKAQMDLQRTRKEQSDELQGLRGGSPSTAMGALQKRAAQLSAQAEAMRVIADIGAKPAATQATLDALRASVAAGAAGASPTALERLKSLSKPAA